MWTEADMSVEAGEGLLCIMFTDLVGWTELGERVGDEAAASTLDRAR